MNAISKTTNRFAAIVFLSLLLSGVTTAFAQGRQTLKKSYQTGRNEALTDIAQNKYRLKSWGLSETKLWFEGTSWPTRDEIYQSILKENYSITFDLVAACLIDPATEAYARGYNDVANTAIDAKYGKGLLEKVRQLANQEFELKYSAQERARYLKFQETLRSLPKPSNQRNQEHE